VVCVWCVRVRAWRRRGEALSLLSVAARVGSNDRLPHLYTSALIDRTNPTLPNPTHQRTKQRTRSLTRAIPHRPLLEDGYSTPPQGRQVVVLPHERQRRERRLDQAALRRVRQLREQVQEGLQGRQDLPRCCREYVLGPILLLLLLLCPALSYRARIIDVGGRA